VDWHTVGNPSIDLGNEALQLVPRLVVEVEVWVSESVYVTCSMYRDIAYR
jgi:hypothetical protein